MSDKKVVVELNGLGFGGLLTVLFIGLKLTGHIDWGWLWVLAPIWVPVIFALVLLVFFVAISLWVGRG